MATLHVFSKVQTEEPRVIFAKAETLEDAKNELSSAGRGLDKYAYVGVLEESEAALTDEITNVVVEDGHSPNVAIFEQI